MEFTASVWPISQIKKYAKLLKRAPVQEKQRKPSPFKGIIKGKRSWCSICRRTNGKGHIKDCPYWAEEGS